MSFHDAFGDGKTKPGALPAVGLGILRLDELVEDAREGVRRDAGAIVDDVDRDLIGCDTRGHHNMRLRRRVRDRIGSDAELRGAISRKNKGAPRRWRAIRYPTGLQHGRKTLKQ